MICPRCSHETDTVKAGVVNGRYVDNYCNNCINTLTKSSDRFGKYNRDRQREDYRRDIIQPMDGDKPNKEFIREYSDKAKEIFTSEEIEKFG